MTVLNHEVIQSPFTTTQVLLAQEALVPHLVPTLTPQNLQTRDADFTDWTDSS